MYSTKKAKEFSENTSKFLSAGIHDNVAFTGAKIGISPMKGSKFIELSFEKNGQEFKHTEWEPTKYEGDTDDKLANKALGQINRFGQILDCFFTEIEDLEVSTFTEYSKWVVDKLNSADKTKLVRLKVVYNKKGYTTLPSYFKYLWIESMSKEKSEIEARPDDCFVRPIQPDVPVTESNPFQSQDAVSTSVEPLPFQ